MSALLFLANFTVAICICDLLNDVMRSIACISVSMLSLSNQQHSV